MIARNTGLYPDKAAIVCDGTRIDFNGDGRIGLLEIIHILQEAVGVRW
jgi:hypothetical protein